MALKIYLEKIPAYKILLKIESVIVKDRPTDFALMMFK